MVRGYHQYKEIWEAEVGEQLTTADSLIKNQHACSHVCANGRGSL